MAAIDDSRLELEKIKFQIVEIAGDIDTLIAGVKPAMSDLEAQEVVDGLRGISKTLEGVAAKYPAPPEIIPPTEPTQ